VRFVAVHPDSSNEPIRRYEVARCWGTSLRRGWLLCWLAAGAVVAQAASGPPVPVVATAVLERAEALLAEGNASECYELLAPLATRAGGNLRFDQALALAALGAGRAADAVAPLRRVLAGEPRLEGARLDLARALRDSGQAEAARAEYRFLLEHSVSALTRGIAQRSLDALGAGVSSDNAAARAGAAAKAWIPSITLGAGYDSNANAATTDSSFNGFTLDPRATEQGSPFVEAGAALRRADRLADGVELATQMRAAHRVDTAARFVDQSVVDAGTTLSLRRHGWLGTLGLNGAWVWVDGRAYAGTGYFEAAVSRPFGEHWELAGLARGGRVDYRQQGYAPLDVERYLWGGALQRFGLGGGGARLGLALLGGRDVALRRGSPFSNDRYGARLFGAWRLDARRELYGELSWLTSDFYGAQGFLGVDRLDRQYVAAFGLESRDWPAPGWSIGPQLRATRSTSNVGIFEFDRVEVAIFMRREFR
jgi:hypothetical protein